MGPRVNQHTFYTRFPQSVEILASEERFWNSWVTDFDGGHHSNTRNVPQAPRCPSAPPAEKLWTRLEPLCSHMFRPFLRLERPAQPGELGRQLEQPGSRRFKLLDDPRQGSGETRLAPCEEDV